MLVTAALFVNMKMSRRTSGEMALTTKYCSYLSKPFPITTDDLKPNLQLKNPMVKNTPEHIHKKNIPKKY